MKRKIYIYTCMDCGFEWDNTFDDEKFCPMCKSGDLHMEEEENDQDSD